MSINFYKSSWLRYYKCVVVGRVTAVGIGTRYGLDGPVAGRFRFKSGLEVWIPGTVKVFR